MAEILRKQISTNFRLNGLRINSEAADYIVSILSPLPGKEQTVWLGRLIDTVQKAPLNKSLITKDIIQNAAKECGRGELENQGEILSFVSAFDVPRMKYDGDKKKFISCSKSGALFSDATDKSSLFRERYFALLQRTLHHELFAPQVHGVDREDRKDKYNLKFIEFLIGSSQKLTDLIILGMITQLVEGKYFLEDTTGSVELDLSEAKFHTGLYTENCFVLAEGHYEDKIFHISAIGLPPPESASVTRSYFGAVNFFGGPSTHANRDRLEILEREQEGTTFVILSDLHLDNVTAMDKLRILFDGYADSPPCLFIFMGNFLAEPHGAQSAKTLRDQFNTLGDVISEFKTINDNSQFVFLPGPSDPGFVNIFPRPPFADCITGLLREKVKNVLFASNPLRIKYCTKEIVIFREDIMTKMYRNSLYFPSTGNIAHHFVSTLIGQGNLCPLPMHVCPIYWSYGHAMSLYPLPDLVIVGDKADPFTVTNLDCTFINPGSFVKTDFSFKVYFPCDGRVEDCQIPDE
ncbi:unnamed protein product [Orchesella dallaii]|uniref:DNA polymerase epsilon subunit n=1 Tax=Orchesella dallaii TaxID=48710 RepID=A0ABP1QV61_9HEXA